MSISSFVNVLIASLRDAPHMLSVGRKLTQTAGRDGKPNKAQR